MKRSGRPAVWNVWEPWAREAWWSCKQVEIWALALLVAGCHSECTKTAWWKDAPHFMLTGGGFWGTRRLANWFPTHKDVTSQKPLVSNYSNRSVYLLSCEEGKMHIFNIWNMFKLPITCPSWNWSETLNSWISQSTELENSVTHVTRKPRTPTIENHQNAHWFFLDPFVPLSSCRLARSSHHVLALLAPGGGPILPMSPLAYGKPHPLSARFCFSTNFCDLDRLRSFVQKTLNDECE